MFDRLQQLKRYLARYGELYRHFNGTEPTVTVPIVFESNQNLRFWVGTSQPTLGTEAGDFWFDGTNLMRLRQDGNYRNVDDYWTDIPTSIINIGHDFNGIGRFIKRIEISGNNYVNAARKTRYLLNAIWSDDQMTVVEASGWLVQPHESVEVPQGTGIIKNAKGQGNFTAGVPSSDTRVVLRATYGALAAEKVVVIKGATTNSGAGSAQVIIEGPKDVTEGQTAQYRATVRYSDGAVGSAQAPVWAISPKAAGHIDANGLLTASKSQADVEAVVSCYAPYVLGGAGGTYPVTVRDTNITNQSAPFYGLGAPGLTSADDLLTLPNRGRPGMASGTFQLAAGPGQKMYYVYPKALGLVTIENQVAGGVTDKWTAGGTDNQPRTVMLNDEDGQPVEFYVYETEATAIPATSWRAASQQPSPPADGGGDGGQAPAPAPGPSQPPLPSANYKTINVHQNSIEGGTKPAEGGNVPGTLTWNLATNGLSVVSQMFPNYNPGQRPRPLHLWDGQQITATLQHVAGTTWQGTYEGQQLVAEAMSQVSTAFVDNDAQDSAPGPAPAPAPAPQDPVVLRPTAKNLEWQADVSNSDDLAQVTGQVTSVTVNPPLPGTLHVEVVGGHLRLSGEAPETPEGTYTITVRGATDAAFTLSLTVRAQQQPTPPAELGVSASNVNLNLTEGEELEGHIVAYTTGLAADSVEVQSGNSSLQWAVAPAQADPYFSKITVSGTPHPSDQGQLTLVVKSGDQQAIITVNVSVVETPAPAFVGGPYTLRAEVGPINTKVAEISNLRGTPQVSTQPDLPTGLSLSATQHDTVWHLTLVGTVQEAATGQTTITVTDPDTSKSAETTLSYEIGQPQPQPLTLDPNTLTFSGPYGQHYVKTVQAAGATNITTAGATPTGMSARVNGNQVIIEGTPEQATTGVQLFTVHHPAGNAELTVNWQFTNRLVLPESEIEAVAYLHEPFSRELTLTAGTAQNVTLASGTTPQGINLIFSGPTITFSGVATEATEDQATYTVQDGDSQETLTVNWKAVSRPAAFFRAMHMDGPVKWHTGPATYQGGKAWFKVEPYFASSATYWGLKNEILAPEEAAKWLNWWQENRQGGTGSTLVHYVTEQGEKATSLPGASPEVPADHEDATDSNLAMWLAAIAAYKQRKGSLDGLKPDVLEAVSAAYDGLKALKDESDHLTKAKESYPMKYLMDNIEVLEGLKAVKSLLEETRPETAQEAEQWATALEQTIKTELFDNDTGLWKVEKGQAANLTQPYPGVMAQVWPILFDLDRSKGLTKVEEQWANWTQQAMASATHQVDVALAAAANALGDTEKVKQWRTSVLPTLKAGEGYAWPFTVQEASLTAPLMSVA